MNFTEIFKDALKYPSQNWKIVLILGVLLLIPELISTGGSLDSTQPFLPIFGGIIGIILGIFVSGYLVSDLKSTIESNDSLPEIDLSNNIIDGLKYLVVNIVYAIIYVILLMVFGFLIVFSSEVSGILVAIFGIIALILVIAIALFALISYARLADTGSIGEALNLKEVWEDINTIGIGNLITWALLLILIGIAVFIILMVIFVLAAFIPYLLIVITFLISLLVAPYFSLFTNRALGLLYAER
ncbi:DUF4013 domain-containing protein [Methanobrevibacter sp. DSM 116169]|uniref:DUF4013 domain-containing protein n=1 Tax=Methanobrevibacter sp. DSM 116169 TaxID=3242727 RepID=UPI0038FD33B5